MTSLQKIKDIVIYRDENYNTFPDAIKKADGTIMVAFRQAPDWQKIFENVLNKPFDKISHCDPASRALYIQSGDDGRTWDVKPSILYDDFVYGVQDPCLNLLHDGSLFGTFHMWKVFSKEDLTEQLPGDITIFDRYLARSAGSYTIRSQDGGLSWDTPVPVRFADPMMLYIRGNCVELDDGTILAPFYGSRAGHPDTGCIILKSADRGRTWQEQAAIFTEAAYALAEPNLYRTKSGKLVLFIRSQPLEGDRAERVAGNQASPLFTCESLNDGQTWSALVKRSVYSPSPFHVLRLQSGKVFLSYGYRYQPCGIRAMLLDAECEDFSADRELILRDDGLGFDIGYTSSVQLGNGDILVTYYYYHSDGCRYIAGTICRES